MLVKISHKKKLLAIIIKANFKKEGVEFFTPNNFSQQLGYMKRAKGYIIDPHIHNPVTREVEYTKEVLFIKSGKVRVDFYDNDKKYLPNLCSKLEKLGFQIYATKGTAKALEDTDVRVKIINKVFLRILFNFIIAP